MHPALKQNLRSADGDELFDLTPYLVKAQHIGILVLMIAVKRAKFTVHPARVRVVDVSIHDKGRDAVRVQLALAR